HQTYKWEDTRIIREFLIKNGCIKRIPYEKSAFKPLYITNSRHIIGKSFLKKISYKLADNRKRYMFVYSWETIKTCILLQKHVKAPIRKQQIVGQMRVYVEDTCINKIDLIACQDCEKNSLLKVIKHCFNMFLSI
ncbi:MAG: hypothetical protein E7277_08790, partial [Lachnospiraceae bacterium]|nr:hypothetical protein [Lachnospiraceae bacterium]